MAQLNNIEAERARNELTIEQLCKKLGITSKTYYHYRMGQAIPSNVLIKLSDIFGCSIDYLLGLTSSPTAIKYQNPPM